VKKLYSAPVQMAVSSTNTFDYTHLRQLARQLYIDSCIMNRNEENRDMVIEESEIWFEYTYDNERYPR